MQLSGVMVYPQLVDLVDDLATGLMLSQLVYWFSPGKGGKPKLKDEAGGRLWLLRTYREWHDACRLSERQCRRSVKQLTEMGLLETQFKLVKRVLTPHLWLNMDRLKELLHIGTGVVTKRDGGGHASYGPLKAEIKEDYEAQAFAHSATARPSPVAVGEAVHTAEAMLESNWTDQQIEVTLGDYLPGDWKMKAEEVLAQKKAEPAVGKTVMSLELLWKRRMSLLHTPDFVRSFTGKERGQLRMFMEKCGPPAGDALDWALQNWGKFCLETQFAKGLTASPDKPVVGFLLQHHDVLMQLVAEPVPAAPEPPPAIAPMQLIAKPAPVPDTDKAADQAVAKEMLAKWLAKGA